MHETARQHFPRGLTQPEHGFRFSVDALLLACFAPRVEDAALDLGAGCGVVGLGLLLRGAARRVVGVDMDRGMVAAARENAGRLGYGDVYQALELDVRKARGEVGIEAESFGLVTANPPYRRPGTGRRGREERSAARFEETGTLEDFTDAAAYAVRNKGAVCLVHLAERLADVLEALRGRRLEPKRVRFVHSRQGEPAGLVLVEARKNGGPGLAVEPPLALYGPGKEDGHAPDALAFCPFLSCNAGANG